MKPRYQALFLALTLIFGACTSTATELSGSSVAVSSQPVPVDTATTPATPPTTQGEFLSTTSTTEPFQPTLFCFEESPPPYGREEAPYSFDQDFYTHYCSASGIFIVGSNQTPIEALEAAGQIVDRMFQNDPQLVGEIIRSNHAVILTGMDETAGDLPEWVYEEGRTFAPDPAHPGLAGSGGGLSYVVAPADDVLCEVPPDKHGSYGTPDWGSVLVHELGHLAEEASGLTGLDALFEVGSNSGAWDRRHYAMTNPREYWAEVVQVYLGQYERSKRGFRHPRTRAELRTQDPTAFDLAANLFGGSTLVHYWCDMYSGPVVELPSDPDAGVESG